MYVYHLDRLIIELHALLATDHLILNNILQETNLPTPDFNMVYITISSSVCVCGGGGGGLGKQSLTPPPPKKRKEID